MSETPNHIRDLLLGSAMLAFLLAIVVNGLALSFWPNWASRQPWCFLNERRLRRQFAMFNMEDQLTEGNFRFTGVMLLFFFSVVAVSLFLPGYSGLAQGIWILVFFTMWTVKGFALAFSPRWLVTRFPSLTRGYEPTKSGRIWMRIVGAAMLLLVAWAVYTVASFSPSD